MGGRHLLAIKAQLDAIDDPSVFYIYLENSNIIVKICDSWSEDRQSRDFSKYDVHCLCIFALVGLVLIHPLNQSLLGVWGYEL